MTTLYIDELCHSVGEHTTILQKHIDIYIYNKKGE